MNVAARTVDDCAAETARVRELGQNVAPNSAIFPATVVTALERVRKMVRSRQASARKVLDKVTAQLQELESASELPKRFLRK